MVLPINSNPATGSQEMTLIDQLLADQRSLTAVERFSRWHETAHATPGSKKYSSLLPARKPAQGQQYAFEVDLDQCSGCKACVTACHALNGLDDTETWRNVGLLVGETGPLEKDRTPIDLNVDRSQSGCKPASTLVQHVTTACHHCADPGCLNGCPVLAYDKDPVTGIVRHLDDQCIGCQYCVMKCPYDVPKYSDRMGIVRKCDMCTNRLAVGEAPACVQACPTEAIRISIVDTDEILSEYRGKTDQGRISSDEGMSEAASRQSSSVISGFLPASPDPSITAPTTRYRTSRSFSQSVIPGDAHDLQPAEAHVPLSVMLVLTQAGVGILLFEALVGSFHPVLTLVAAALSILGMGLGALHLGQPTKAWRAFLGWRKSWLSREMIAFGGFVGALSLHALIAARLTWAAAAMMGLVSVYCSAMVYIDTRRAFWNGSMTFPKFGLTTALLGAAGTLAVGTLFKNSRPVFNGDSVTPLAWLVLLLAASKLATEFALFVMARDPAQSTLARSARLHTSLLKPWFAVRIAMIAIGGFALPALMVLGVVSTTVLSTVLLFTTCLLGELAERHLFFRAEAAPRMPGGI